MSRGPGRLYLLAETSKRCFRSEAFLPSIVRSYVAVPSWRFLPSWKKGNSSRLDSTLICEIEDRSSWMLGILFDFPPEPFRPSVETLNRTTTIITTENQKRRRNRQHLQEEFSIK